MMFAASALAVCTTAAAVAAPLAQTGAATSVAHLARAASAARAAAAAPAAVQAAHPGTCTGSGSSRSCEIPVRDVNSVSEFNPINFRRSDGTPNLIEPGSLVDITCW